MNWLTVLALQTLRLVAVPGTGLLIFNDFMSLLTLLVLAGFAWTLTCFTLLAALHWNEHDPLTSDQKGWQTLDNGGTLCSFNKKKNSSLNFLSSNITIWCAVIQWREINMIVLWSYSQCY